MSAKLPFDYTVVRSSRRRTLSLSVDKGRVEVRVPERADRQWVEQWVRAQVDWVMPRLSRQTEALQRHQVRIEQGGAMMLRGQAMTLSWRRGQRTAVNELGERLDISLSPRISRPEAEAVEQVLKRWLAQRAQDELGARCMRLGDVVGRRPQSVKVRDYRRKWGQCTSRGEITLNWRLIHLPPVLQDYVMIHELCHLEQMNHGPEFWRLVGNFCPNYRELREVMVLKYPYLIW